MAVPFVLNSQPTAAYEEADEVKSLEAMAQVVHRRYAEIMRDVEGLVDDHSTSGLPRVLVHTTTMSLVLSVHSTMGLAKIKHKDDFRSHFNHCPS